MSKSHLYTLISVVTLSCAEVYAQPAPEQERDAPLKQPDQQKREPPADPSAKMEHMADAMASMAQTCQTMMQREMATYHWRMAVLTGLGLVSSVALILFVVLEVLWIRLVALRIKQASRDLRANGP